MLDFSRFKFITFDCYGTLIDWESGILSALRPLLQQLEAAAEAGEYRSYRDVLREVVRGFGQRLGFEVSTAEVDSLPDSIATWKPFPDTANALNKLHARFQLAIISNIDDDLFAASARQFGIDFDHVITAAQAGAYKPSPTIFWLAQQKLSVSTQEWFHAGQSIYHDVIHRQLCWFFAVRRPCLMSR
jgi:2-haloacid dehalogenase